MSDRIRDAVDVVFDALRGIERLVPLRIDGVEVTQAIQYYHADQHLSDPADRGPDNSVRLIANKPAWVRVYVRSRLPDQIPDVTGTVEVQRVFSTRKYPPSVDFEVLATHVPQAPAFVAATTLISYADERRHLGASLNFIIPAEEMFGVLRLLVRVSARGGYSDQTTVDLDVTLRQTLNVAAILVNYKGSDGTNLPAPTMADLKTDSALTLLMYPVQSAATYETAGTFELTFALTDARDSSPCTKNWRCLGTLLSQSIAAEQNRPDVVYVALLPAATPVGPAVTGCDAGGVSIMRTGQQVGMAHEIGHQCGLKHAPCDDKVPNPDPNYPAYEPYDQPVGTPTASIGEYGLDISTGAIYSPKEHTKDFMSYCCKLPYPPPWISLYDYGKLIENLRLDPEVVGALQQQLDPLYEPEIPWYEWVQQVISIVGTVHANGDIGVNHVARVDAVPVVRGGTVSDLTVELLRDHGKALASAAVHRLSAQAHGCGCPGCSEAREGLPPYNFQAYVPDVARGSALRIVRGKEELWSAKARDREPSIRRFSVKVVNRNFLRADWEVEHAAEHEPDVWLRWSSDRGRTWHALATGLRGRFAKLELAHIRSGRVIIQMLAHDGFQTAVSKRVALTVPRRPPSVAILRPRAGAKLAAGSPLRLWGVVTACTGEAMDGKTCHWLIDGKEVARGCDAWITAPTRGRHKCTLVVQDGRRQVEKAIVIESVR